MTLFGYDGSDFTSVQNFAGLSFVTHKITEATPGQIFEHFSCGSTLARAKAQGVPFIGPYVVPRSGLSTAEQADIAIAALNRQAPWALNDPGFFWQSDLERWPYDSVEPGLGVELLDQLRLKTGKPAGSGMLYASRGQYGDSIPGSDNLWNAAYVGGAGGYRELYPGDGHPQWSPYSGRTPLIWQYSESAIFADGNRGDANAFRGTVEDFRRIILGGAGGGDDEMARLVIPGQLPSGFAVDKNDHWIDTDKIVLPAFPEIGVGVLKYDQGWLSFYSDFADVTLRVAVKVKGADWSVRTVKVLRTADKTGFELPWGTTKVSIARIASEADFMTVTNADGTTTKLPGATPCSYDFEIINKTQLNGLPGPVQ